MMDRELMAQHVEALYTRDAEGKLLRVNEPGGAAAPAMFLGRTPAGNVWAFREGLPADLERALTALCESERADMSPEPRHLPEYLRLLGKVKPWTGPAYIIDKILPAPRQVVSISPENATLLHGGFEKLLDEVGSRPFLFALIEEARAVSVCRSVRVAPHCHEAGLETLPEYRRRGLARDVVAAWASAVRNSGVTPMYSTSWTNLASQAVARSLNMRQYGVDFHVG